jgi:hypothetical protein
MYKSVVSDCSPTSVSFFFDLTVAVVIAVLDVQSRSFNYPDTINFQKYLRSTVEHHTCIYEIDCFFRTSAIGSGFSNRLCLKSELLRMESSQDRTSRYLEVAFS